MFGFVSRCNCSFENRLTATTCKIHERTLCCFPSQQADELEEEFLQLVLDHRHEVATTTTEGANSIHPDDHGVLCLPPERLSAWPPVRAMVESGAAVEDDVTTALQKAKEASAGGGGEVDFVGFLEFVHNLDLEV